MFATTPITSDGELALGLVSLSLGIAVLGVLLNPRDVLSRRFSALLAVSAAAIAARALFLAGERTAMILEFGTLGLQPVLLLSFCERFAERYTSHDSLRTCGRTRAVHLMMLAVLLLAVAKIAALGAPKQVAEALTLALAGAVLITTSVGMSILWRHSTSNALAQSRGPSRVVFAGIFLAYVPSLIGHLVPAALHHQPFVSTWQMAALLLALPAAVGVSSVRWRRASLIALIDRVSVYLLLAATLLGLEVVTVMALQHVLAQNVSLVTQALTLVLASLTAVTYAPLRMRLQRLLDTLFYRDYYDVGPTVQRFSQELATLRDQEDVVNCLLDGLAETLNLSGIAFVALPEGLDPQMLRLIEVDDLRARRIFATPKGRAEVLRGLTTLDLTAQTLSWQSPLLLRPWPGCEALALVGPARGGDGMALLVIGPKRAGSPLRRDDQALLVTLAHQAAAALANAVLVGGLKTSLAQVRVSTEQLVAARAEQQLLLRELVNADERQRAALARDLHDDALQEVLYLIRHSRWCQGLAESLDVQIPHDSSEEAARSGTRQPAFARLRQELGQVAERSEVVERKLRALYLGLYPALLPSLGLPPALEDLSKELAASTGLDIEVTYGDDVLTAAQVLDTESALHVYRIVQEALRNAAKHGGANRALVRLNIVSDTGNQTTRRGARQMLALSVGDDGEGLSLPIDHVALLRKGHLGLAGMRERAERISASLEFGTRPGGGTLVSLLVPIVASEPVLSGIGRRTLTQQGTPHVR